MLKPFLLPQVIQSFHMNVGSQNDRYSPKVDDMTESKPKFAQITGDKPKFPQIAWDKICNEGLKLEKLKITKTR